MNPLLLSSALELGKSIIGRILPDKEAQSKAESDLLVMMTTQDFKQVMAQLEINAREAAHPSIFVSGGRPFIMWICGLGLAYATLIQPILVWVSTIKGWSAPPDVNVDVLMYVLGGLLGLSGLRSVEKVKGVASK